MISSIGRQIFKKQSIGSCGCSKLGGARMISSSSSDESAPWLMLPPAVSEGGGIVYKFYSLAEKKVLRINNNEFQSESESEYVGSSHGWIALFNRRTNDLFLSNPLTRRHIKLPPFHDLLDYNARMGYGNVTKVILSSSPDEYDEGCRAMMTFGPANRLALCSPVNQTKWTPFEGLYDLSQSPPTVQDQDTTAYCAKVHEDLVYRKRHKVFATITGSCELKLDSFRISAQLNVYDHSLNSTLPETPIHVEEDMLLSWVRVKEKMGLLQLQGNTRYWVKKHKALLKDQCLQIPHIVYAQHSDQLYVAIQFVMLINSDGTPVYRVPFCPLRGLAGYFSSKTVGFVLLKLNDGDGAAAEIVDDLNGLVMFVGINHSFALPASDFPELKPDSIYFTDSKRIKRICGRNDIGIFDYQNKTITEVVSSDEFNSIFDSDDPPSC